MKPDKVIAILNIVNIVLVDERGSPITDREVHFIKLGIDQSEQLNEQSVKPVYKKPFYYCPECNELLHHTNKYCSKCGKIDWSKS